MNLFAKLLKKMESSSATLSGLPQEEDSVENTKQTASSAKELKGSNGIEKMANLTQTILGWMSSNWEGAFVNIENATLEIAIQDSAFLPTINREEYKVDLSQHVYAELGLNLKKVLVYPVEEISDIHTFTELLLGVYVHLITISESVARTAKISIVPGCGSLIEGPVQLDAKDFIKKPNFKYNIGIGKMPELQNGITRFNHIAVDDNPEAPDFERNRYVSRAHAHISYDDSQGFFLFVDSTGTRLAGKRTHIQRDDQLIELDNPIVSQLLEDGDIIILSKKVKLLFNINC